MKEYWYVTDEDSRLEFKVTRHPVDFEDYKEGPFETREEAEKALAVIEKDLKEWYENEAQLAEEIDRLQFSLQYPGKTPPWER